MDTKKVIKYWRESAQRDFEVAQSLLRLKHYAACLFYCHLSLEKILKGLVVAKIKTHAPYVHELDVLVKKADLKLTKEQMQELEVITTFNINARYDDVKYSFYKRCTKDYADKYFGVSKKLYLWLKKQYPKK